MLSILYCTEIIANAVRYNATNHHGLILLTQRERTIDFIISKRYGDNLKYADEAKQQHEQRYERFTASLKTQHPT